MPELIIEQLKAAAIRGVRVILIHGLNTNNIDKFEQVKQIQLFSIQSLHSKMVYTRNAVLMFSANVTLQTQSETALYLDSTNREFNLITNRFKEQLSGALSVSPVTLVPKIDPVEQNLGSMLSELLKDQKEDLKNQIVNEMMVIMTKLLSSIQEVKSEVQVSNQMIHENLILTKQIQSELKSIIPCTLKSIADYRNELNIKHQEDTETSCNLISEMIVGEVRKIQAKIDRHNCEKAEEYLERLFECSWSKIINLEAKKFLVTSEVIYSAMKDLPQLDYSPALIPITKALEDILDHFLFNEVVNNIPPTDIQDQNKYKSIRVKNGPNIGTILDHSSIGDIIYMFKDSDVINLLVARRVFQGNIRSDPYFIIDDRFRNRLLNLNPVSLIGKLNLVREKYRNKVAHKDGISKTTVEECRQYMLFGQAFIKEFLGKLN